MKEQVTRDKKVIHDLHSAQTHAIESLNISEINSLMVENKHLSELLVVKSDQINKLYKEI